MKALNCNALRTAFEIQPGSGERLRRWAGDPHCGKNMLQEGNIDVRYGTISDRWCPQRKLQSDSSNRIITSALTVQAASPGEIPYR